MLDIILKILSILGIAFLVLFALLVIALLLVLFFPVSYRIRGSKDKEGFWLSVKVKWLFGLLRAEYQYPEPGHVVAKALWFSVYNSLPAKHSPKSRLKVGQVSENLSSDVQRQSGDGKDEENGATDSAGDGLNADEGTPEDDIFLDEDEQLTWIEKISQKIRKIKYTICNIYDKIKEIWKNISYYITLIQQEDTKQLFGDILARSGKILKHIRPRHIKAEILFGTGSPDTTGYAYGMYCILASIIGSSFLVTPDFERAVLEGEIDMSGRITIGVLAVNGLRLLLDKKLRKFIKKMQMKA